MYINIKAIRNHDFGLIITTVIAVILFVVVTVNIAPRDATEGQISNLSYLVQDEDGLTFDNILNTPSDNWTPIDFPVNLGLSPKVHWFYFTLKPDEFDSSRLLMQFNFTLTDKLDVGIFNSADDQLVAYYEAGDNIDFFSRPILNPTPLFPIPKSDQLQKVVVRIETAGSIRFPVDLWDEDEFIEYNSNHTLAVGLFFGFLTALGICNLFLFITTRNRSFLFYSLYVFSLTLTLVSLLGFGFAYLWPNQPWFQGRSGIIFANATLLFGIMFTRQLLPIASFSRSIDKLMYGLSWFFGLGMLVIYLVPYSILLRIFFVMLCLVIVMTLLLSGWLSFKGVAVARYFSIAWTFLLVSGIASSLDNLGIITLPIPSNYLLVIGGAVESLILTLVLAISYSRSRDEFIETQQFALEQEVQANLAKQELLEVQKRYQDDLEYKVQERTLELQVTLRELSEVNQELERLTSIDPLTGINNRRHFDKRLVSEGRRSRREQTPLSLAIIDIDHFKKVNDHYGHAGGDSCLIHITRIIQSTLNRATDDLCRIGGEEFALILPNTDEEGATHVMEVIRERIENTPLNYEGQSVKLTISVGISTAVIENDEQTHALFRFADEQLYKAKESGRNRIIYHRFIG